MDPVKYQFLWIIWWEWEHSGTITPSEIDNLWYHTDYPDDSYKEAYPDETIVLTLVCNGFYDDPVSMANAWVDNGAEAFVGATISIPVVGSDDYSMEFWEELCDNNGTIKTSTIALCDCYNSTYCNDYNYWYLNDEWEILGNIDASEP